MDIGKLIYNRRIELGLTLEEVGNAVGVAKSTVKKWEDGFIANMRRDKIALLAKVLKINPVSLIINEDENIDRAIPLPTNNIFMCPIFNSVAAGFGAMAQDTIIEYIPTYLTTPSEKDLYIWITVQGDSMAPKIEDGSKILVRKQTSVDSGQIAVILIDGDEAVVKKVIYTDDKIELHSFNPYYPPRIFEGSEIQRIQVLGLVKEVSKTLQ